MIKIGIPAEARRFVAALALAICGVRSMAQTPQPSPKIADGETLSILHVTLRQNYVVPNQVSLPEGWCRIVIRDPNQIGGGQQISLNTDTDVRLSNKNLEARSAKAEMYYRLSPGKHKLRIGTKNEWVVQVEVSKKTK